MNGNNLLKAIEYIGLKLVTTKEELDKMEIPVSRSGKKAYGYRKIDVSRDGIISKSRINDILNGKNSLKTVDEMKLINKSIGLTLSISQPKGIATCNNSESKAIDDLDILIGISKYIQREHLIEHRLYDIAYCMIDDINIQSLDKWIFVADQVKSSRVNENGQLNFQVTNGSLTVYEMLKKLENGSLTCIGQKRDGTVDVVWFFYGVNSINLLHNFDVNQIFCPRLHLTVKSNNEFTIAMNSPMFRFDVGKSEKECNRLLEKKIDFIKNGTKNSLKFWNEDDSQIPCEQHRIEQRSFNMTRTACNTIDIKVERKHENAYGSVDFIVNENVRVQDKATTRLFNMRGIGKFPYNPDDIDIFQVSDLVNNIIYAIPMRVVSNDGMIISFFTDEQLMRKTIYLSVEWKNLHEQFKYDFKTKEGIVLYVKACGNASKIPELTDRNFYRNMINENKDEFGSKKQVLERKMNV